MYKVSHAVADLGLDYLVWHSLPNSAWVEVNLAEVAWQVGKMVEHQNSKTIQLSSTTTWITL